MVIDRFSRKAIGWALDKTLASRLVVTAPKQAIAKRQPQPGLVHHSDRGVRYACADYVQLLEAHGLVASMSGPANLTGPVHPTHRPPILRQQPYTT